MEREIRILAFTLFQVKEKEILRDSDDQSNDDIMANTEAVSRMKVIYIKKRPLIPVRLHPLNHLLIY